MKVSVVIPCYNERNTIAEIVSTVRTAPLPDIEIIVVDDGSTDGSRTILKRNVEPIADRVIYHGVNRGKGAALRSGFAAATGGLRSAAAVALGLPAPSPWPGRGPCRALIASGRGCAG